MQAATDIKTYIQRLASQAKKAASDLSNLDSRKKNATLSSLATIINARRVELMIANKKDLDQAAEKGLSDALVDRLALDDARIDSMINGINQVIALPDPIGEISDMRTQASGLRIGKMRVPIGVIGIIFESRPNVTIDAAILCFKSANACILRGGSEAYNSNTVLASCIKEALLSQAINPHVIQYIDTTDREAVGHLITLPNYIDVIIPRGGKSLIERISAQATVPVIKHLDGICHVYIDDTADIKKAIEVAYNAKARRYGVCGSMETLLIHQDIAALVLPELVSRFNEKGVELRGDKKAQAMIPSMTHATEQDWSTEYLGPILSVAIVEDIEQAIHHINHYGSHHTDAIISDNLTRTQRFINQVDSSSVMVNASTQFADGFEYGLGAEIGISTGKLHVRGPVGLQGLTTQKYVVYGDGHIRA